MGAETDRKLGIPGEDLKGSHTATEFVAWYNGHPEYREREFDLSHETAVIIGQGNVAADVARILAKNADELKFTDISQHALDVLEDSKVKNIFVVGRRGPAQGAMTSKELKEFGIEIAIDDFGTGFSSLSYLQKLPLDRLKIDRAFIKDLPGQDCQAIAALIISLGARLGLKTIAEGVETQAQADYLAQLGCDEVQGFMYAKPMPEKELITYLQAKQ